MWGMAVVATKASLPPARARLVELMQEVNHGRFENLAVRNGEPVLDPPPHLLREVKFGGENGPRPEADKKDFALKAQVRLLFAHMDALGTGVIRSLEVKHGLPFRMTIEEGAA